MVERLYQEERPYGGEKGQALTEQIQRLEAELTHGQTPEERKKLDQLSVAYLRRSDLAVRDAFIQGVWAGMELMMEYRERRTL